MSGRCSSPRKGATKTGRTMNVDGRKRTIYKGPRGGLFYISKGCKQYIEKKSGRRKSSGKKKSPRRRKKKSSGRKSYPKTTFCKNKIDPKRKGRFVVNPTSLRVVKADGERGCDIEGPFMTKPQAQKRADMLKESRKVISPRGRSRSLSKSPRGRSKRSKSPRKVIDLRRRSKSPRRSRKTYIKNEGDSVYENRSFVKYVNTGMPISLEDAAAEMNINFINVYAQARTFIIDDPIPEIVVWTEDGWITGYLDIQEYLGVRFEQDGEKIFLNGLDIPPGRYIIFQQMGPDFVLERKQYGAFEVPFRGRLRKKVIDLRGSPERSRRSRSPRKITGKTSRRSPRRTSRVLMLEAPEDFETAN